MSEQKIAVKDQIRQLIREGNKTSWIIANTSYPVDLIKAVKSEELELGKKQAREAEATFQKNRAQGKKDKAHRDFLIRMGVDPDEQQKPGEPIYGDTVKSEESNNDSQSGEAKT